MHHFTDDINIFDNQNSSTTPSRFDHQLQQSLIAERFLAAAMPGSGVCDEAKPADICPGIHADQCELMPAPTNTTGALAITASPDSVIAAGGVTCPAALWCDSNVEKRADYCEDGEDPSTHCCKSKATPPTPPTPPSCKPPSGCSSPSAPTTGWPALLGLGAMLPLLAARRRRRK